MVVQHSVYLFPHHCVVLVYFSSMTFFPRAHICLVLIFHTYLYSISKLWNRIKNLGIVTWQIKPSPATPRSHAGTSLSPGSSTSYPLPAKAPGKAAEDYVNLWCHVGETKMELLALPSFGLAQLCPMQQSGGWSSGWKICISLTLYNATSHQIDE